MTGPGAAVLAVHDGRFVVVEPDGTARCVDPSVLPDPLTGWDADGDRLVVSGGGGQAAALAMTPAGDLRRARGAAGPDGTFALFHRGRAVGIAPDGRLVADGAAAARFLLVRPATARLVGHLVRNRWIEDHHPDPTRPGEIAIGPGPCVRVRGVAIGFSEIEDALDGAEHRSPPKQIAFRFGGWRIRRLRLFRPLVYVVAFALQGLLDCAELAIGSLFEFGTYDGDVMMLTSPEFLGFADRLPAPVRARVRMVALPADDVLDYMVTRFRIAVLPEAADYQPVVYMDTDVLVDAPLDDLLAAITRSDAVHLASLGAGTLMDPSNYYGVRLCEQDRAVSDDEAAGFNSGIIAFRNVAEVAGTFERIVGATYAYAVQAGERMFFPAADQCMANYVLHREGRIEGELLTPAVKLANHTIPLDAVWRRGFVHFIGGVGNATPKLVQMRRYLVLMRAVPRADDPLLDRIVSHGAA